MRIITASLWAAAGMLMEQHLSHAQNLVPNPSFETVSPCPGMTSPISAASPWQTPPCPPCGSGATPDIFNACVAFSCAGAPWDVPANTFGVANAYHGNSYAGIVTYYNSSYREYLQVRLTSPLTAGTTYQVRCRVIRASRYVMAANNIGIYVSTSVVNQPGNLGPISGVTPQVEETNVITDSANWTLISGNYLAAGGEEYITIGNFHDNAGTVTEYPGAPPHACGITLGGSTYYYVDSVYVGPTSPLPLTLSAFTGKSADDKVVLQWTAQAGYNAGSFEVLRSCDGQTFSTAGKIPAATGYPQHYTFDDPLTSTTRSHASIYYRLRIVGHGGHMQESEVISVRLRTILPALTAKLQGNRLTLDLHTGQAGTIVISLLDITGREVQHREWHVSAGNNLIQMTVGMLPPGTYYCRVTGTKYPAHCRVMPQ